MKKILLLFVTLFSVMQATAQDQAYTVSGTVISRQDNDVLPGANVILTNTNDNTIIGAASDGDGNFSIENVEPNTYGGGFKSIQISKLAD